ncbi:MAG: hypothetical protein PHU68_05575, partial [Paludibacter sp.]|nr:hypothetical protein [Paludibacter sp.]
MKSNIKYITKLAIMAFMVQAFVSCDEFLTQLPKSSLTQEQVFTDLSVLEPSVDGLYVSYRNAKAGRAGLTFTLLGLDESKQGIVQMMDAGQSGLDYYDGMLNQSSSQISEMWARRWPSINMAAKCIKKVTELKDRVFIQNRPKIIGKRRRFGDWEGDFIVSGKNG